MASPARPRAGSIYDDKVNVTRILLTGGPCAGKTTALAAIKSDLTQLGYKVLEVPEAATILANGGADCVPSGTSNDSLTTDANGLKVETQTQDCASVSCPPSM